MVFGATDTSIGYSLALGGLLILIVGTALTVGALAKAVIFATRAAKAPNVTT